MEENSKYCEWCGEFKSIRKFSKRGKKCFDCSSHFGTDLWRRFKLTVKDYNTKLLLQNGVCAICSKPETTKHHETGKVCRLAVDHCHATGKIRSLLCWRCNQVLGLTVDDPGLLNRLSFYLRSQKLG